MYKEMNLMGLGIAAHRKIKVDTPKRRRDEIHVHEFKKNMRDVAVELGI